MTAGIMNMGLGDASAATGFDPQAYLQANPDLQAIVAQYPGFNLLQHYQLYGIPEGRPKSLEDAAAKVKAAQTAGPPPIPTQPGPALSGSGNGGWDAYLRNARQQTLGLNNLPTMAPTSDRIPADRAAAKAMFAAPPSAPVIPPAGLWGGAPQNMGLGPLGSPLLNGNALAGGASYNG